MAPSDQDLKAQLSDIQKRLSEATFNSPNRPLRGEAGSPGSRATTSPKSTNQHKPHSPSQLSQSVSVGPDDKGKKTLSNFLNKREKRVSLPVLDISRSPSIKSSGKDMDFVVGLSENLLVECRRLQAENQQKSTQLRDLEEQFERLKSNNSSLLSKLNETTQAEERYKDSNWELELKFQQLSQEFKTSNENSLKAQKELARQIDIANEIRTELEEARLNKHTIEEEFASNKASVTHEMQSLRVHVDELNDVNSRLNDEIDELRQKLDAANKIPKEAPLSKIPVLAPQQDSDSEEEFNEPSVSPVKMIPTNNTVLETEQLQSSLSNAHQTIAKLRQQILKLRSNELKGRSPDSKAPIISQAPLLKKSIRGLNEAANRNFQVLGSSNRSSTHVFDESEVEDEWENFEGDSTVGSFNGTPSKRPTRPMSMTSNELINDSESDVDSVDNLEAAPLSSELHVLTIEEVEKYAEEHQLVLLPIQDFESLKTKATVPKDSPFKNFKEADIVSKAKERGFNIFSQQEWSTQNKELLDMKGEVKALNDRMLVISETEKKYAKEAADYRAKLEEATESIKADDAKIKELESKLMNPDTVYIKEHAAKNDMELLSATDHKNLQVEVSSLKDKLNNPSIDFLTKKSGSMGLKVLPIDEHGRLLEELESLKLSSEKSQLELEELFKSNSEAITREKQNSEAMKKQMEDEKSELHKRIRTLTSELEGHVLTKSELETKLAALDKQVLEHQSISKDLQSELEGHVLTKTELETKLAALDKQVLEHQSISKDLQSKLIVASSIHEQALEEHSSMIELLRAESSQKLEELSKSSSSKLSELSDEIQRLKDTNDESSRSLATEVRSKKELEKMIEEPTVDYIKEKASKHNLRVLELVAYEQEISELKNTITRLTEEINSLSDEFGQKSIAFTETIQSLKEELSAASGKHDELVDSARSFKEKLDTANGSITILKNDLDHPSYDYLIEKSSEQGFTIIPKLEHTSLLEKSQKSIHDLAKEDDLAVLKNSELRELKEKIKNPTLDDLSLHAESLNYRLIGRDDYDELVQKSEKSIEEHAADKNLALLNPDELSVLKRKSEEPTVEEITLAAKSHNHSVIATDELSQLREKSAHTIESLAHEKGLKLVPIAYHTEMIRKIETPSTDEIASHAAKSDLELVPKKDYDSLKERAGRTIQDHAKEQDLVILSESEHAELIRKSSKPSITEITTLASAAGMVALSSKGHNDLVLKSNKSIADLAKESGSVVLKEGEYQSVLKKIESPSVEYLTAKAIASDYRLIPSSEFTTLVKKSERSAEEVAANEGLVTLSREQLQELKNPNKETIIALAESAGLASLPVEEYEKLQSISIAPTLNHLSEKAELLGYKMVSSAELTELQTTASSPSKEFILKSVGNHGLVAVPQAKFDESKHELATLRKNFMDQDLLMERVSSDGNVVLKQEAYDELVEKANVTIDDLAEKHNKIVLDQDTYDSLSHPSADKLANIAEEHNLVVVPKDDYHTLVRDHRYPPVEFLQEKAEQHNQILVSKSHYDFLNSSVEKPSEEYLKEKAGSSGLSLIKEAELAQLKEKASKTLKDLAKENKLVVVSEEEFNTMKNPDRAAIVAIASGLELATLSHDELDSLKKSIECPDMNYLQEKAEAHAHVMVSSDELSELRLIRDSPSSEFLASKSSLLNLAIIPAAELTQLKAQAHKSIEDLASENNQVVLSQEEYKSLKSPSKSSLLAMTGALGMIALSASDHQKLVKPSKTDMEKFATSQNMVLVPNNKFADLNQKAARTAQTLADESNLKLLSADQYERLQNPSSERLIEMASATGLIAIDKSEFESLQTPSVDSLRHQASKSGLDVILKEELAELQTKASRSVQDLAKESDSVVLNKAVYQALKEPSSETVVGHAAKLGLVTLSQEAHQALKNPSNDVISAIADREGLKVVEKAAYDELLHPSREAVEQHAAKFDLVTLSQEDHQALKNPSNDVISAIADREGLKVVEKAAYDELLHPSREAVEQHAAKFDLVTLSQEDHQALKNPSNDVISAIADREGLKVVEKAAYDELLHPSREAVEQHAAKFDLVTLSQEDHQALKNPSNDVISAIADREGLKVVEKAAYDELLHPSREAVEQHAAKFDLVTLSQEDHQALKNPSNDVISAIADREGLKVVEKATYDELLHPSREAVEQHAAKFDLVTLSQEDHQALKNPSNDVISAIADREGLKVVEKATYDELLHPSREAIEQHAAESDAIVISRTEHKSLLNPAKQDIEAHARALGLVVLEKDHFNDLTNPSKETIQKLANDNSLVAVEAEKHNELESAFKNPSKDFLKEKADDLNLVLVEREEYNSVTEKAKKSIEELAKENQSVLISPEELENLKRPSLDSLHELAKEKNQIIISSGELESLKNPSTESVTERAGLLGLVILDASTHKELLNTVEEPSKEFIEKNAHKHDLVTIEHDEKDLFVNEYLKSKELVSLSKTHFEELQAGETLELPVISKRLDTLGYVAVDGDAYNKITSELSKEEIVTLCEKKNLKAVEVDEYEKLSAVPTASEITKLAENVGLVTVSEAVLSSLKTKAENPDESVLAERGYVKGDELSYEQLEQLAARFDSKLISSREITNRSLTANSNPSVTTLTSTINESEFTDALSHVVSNASTIGGEHHDDDLEGVNLDDLRTVANRLGFSLVPVGDETTTDTDLAVEEEGNESTVLQETSVDEKAYLAKRASVLGLQVLSSDEIAELQKRSEPESSWTLEKLALGASALGITLVGANEIQSKNTEQVEITKDDIVLKASELGLLVVNKEEYKSLADKAVQLPLSKSEVVEKALEYDLVAVSKEELHDLREKARVERESYAESEQDDTEPPQLTKEELELSARNMGLLAIPENAFVATNISRIPDVNNCVVLPITYYNKLTKSEVLNLDKISNDELQAQVKKRGFLMSLAGSDIRAPESSMSRRDTIASLSTSQSRRNLAEAAENAAMHEYDHPAPRTARSCTSSRTPSISISRPSSTKPISRDISVDGGLSLMTNASLTEARIIPALTQTVIGEYLYKYYRRLGPLSSISETRHERYFWIHPYTLTLYWSTTNPVLGNPTTHKTRAAAIIGVESVDDNNPLPAGLHHKSIIVHSQTRSIKITCPTRQRHNIWYNSLRYLIQRSMDGIELDEDFDRMLDHHKV